MKFCWRTNNNTPSLQKQDHLLSTPTNHQILVFTRFTPTTLEYHLFRPIGSPSSLPGIMFHAILHPNVNHMLATTPTHNKAALDQNKVVLSSPLSKVPALLAKFVENQIIVHWIVTTQWIMPTKAGILQPNLQQW